MTEKPAPQLRELPQIGAELPELMQRLAQALRDDLIANPNPDPRTIPALIIAHDRSNNLIRIAHARQLDLRVEIAYTRVAEFKSVLARILQQEAAIEASLSPAFGRALGGYTAVEFGE